MKKAIKIILAVLVIAAVGGYLYYNSGTKRSERAYAAYYAHLKTLNEYRWKTEPSYADDYLNKAEELRELALKQAMKDKNAPRAIFLLNSVIEDLGRTRHKYGMDFPVTKPAVELQAIYCEQLAMVHSWDRDTVAEQAALKRAKQFEAKAARMK